MKTSQTITSTFRISKRFTCRMTAELPHPQGVSCEWLPSFPRRLQQSEIAAYQRGRDAFFAELGEALGFTIGVVDLVAGGHRLTIPSSPQCEGEA